MLNQAFYRVALILLLFCIGLFIVTGKHFGEDVDTATNEAALSAPVHDTLPAEARETYRLILKGGPFPYQQDGTTFHNRENLLPRKPASYYREYTVRTPGANNRGARRIVCGGENPRQPDHCYYTEDHYRSFREIQYENARP